MTDASSTDSVRPGWVVVEHPVAGSWPHPDDAALGRLAAVVATVPPRGLLLLDGLVASCADTVLVPAAAAGLRVVVLVHLPIGLADPLAAEGERRVLTAASAVVTTSGWARDVLLDAYALAPDAVHVARPGVDACTVVGGHAPRALGCCASPRSPR